MVFSSLTFLCIFLQVGTFHDLCLCVDCIQGEDGYEKPYKNSFVLIVKVHHCKYICCDKDTKKNRNVRKEYEKMYFLWGNRQLEYLSSGFYRRFQTSIVVDFLPHGISIDDDFRRCEIGGVE